MTVKNISAKIINIGATTLMPDAEVILSAEDAKTTNKDGTVVILPAIKALERLKLISISDEPAKAEPATKAKKAKAEQVADKADAKEEA